MTLQITVAAPFRHTRKTGMRRNELVYYYALDRKWMSTDQAAVLLRRAEEAGLLRQENGVFTILFDPATETIPIGFQAHLCNLRDKRSCSGADRPDHEGKGRTGDRVVADMNRIIREQFGGNLLPPAALVLLAKKYGVPYEDLRETLFAR